MPSLYSCTVAGDGIAPATAFRPSFTSGYACLMIDPTRGRALIASNDDTVTGTGIRQLLTAATYPALRTLATTTNPTSAQRTALNTWLTNGGYTGLTAAQVTWAQCIHYAARQVNGAADIATTEAD